MRMSPSSSGATSGSGEPQHQPVEALFVGNQNGMEAALVQRDDIPFAGITAGAMHGVGVLRTLGGAWRTLRGVAQAWGLIGRWRPQAVLLTGGFVGVPVSIAAWLRRVPTLVFLPDIEPGLALKVMARLAWRVAATTPQSASFIDARKLVVTGYPLRNAFITAERERSRTALGLPLDEKVVLVFGGSKGARSINRAVLAELPRLLAGAIVVHVSGQGEWAEVEAAREALPAALKARYRAFAYLHDEMVDALAAADLAVCRSGASSLGELPALGVPAVLIPYPHAWRYQRVNASYLAESGAAVMLEDARLSDPTEGLVVTVERLLADAARLAGMREASAGLGRRDGADNIGRLLAQAAEQTHD